MLNYTSAFSVIATPGPTRALHGPSIDNYGSVPGSVIRLSQQAFGHVAKSVSTSGRVGLPGYNHGFQVAHGGQVSQQRLFSYVKCTDDSPIAAST